MLKITEMTSVACIYHKWNYHTEE